MRKYTVASIVFFTTMMSGLVGADVFIDGQSIPGADIQTIVVSPTNGNIVINTKNGDYTVQKGDIEPPPPGSVVINSFTVTPSELTVGGVVSINWTTTNAVSCTAEGATGPWQATVINLASGNLPSGARNLTMNNANTYNFSLTCNGSAVGDTTTLSRTVVVNPVEPTSCPSTPLAGGVTEWKSFWGVDFPFPVHDNRDFTVPRFGYSALRFNTGNVVDGGSLVAKDTTQTAGVRLGTISECPGDFSAAVPDSCRNVWGLGGALVWATDGRSFGCQLKPNTTYYFNLTYTDGVNSNVSTCNVAPCRSKLQHNNYP